MEFRKSTSISKGKIVTYFITLLVVSLSFVHFNTVHRDLLITILENINNCTGIIIKFDWVSDEPSNINMYLFSGQVALAVLTGTAVSFVSFILNKKVHAFTFKELLMYKFKWYDFNFGELVIINFLMLFLNIPFIFMFYSETVCIMLFIFSLLITYRVVKTISFVFFDDKYLLSLSKRILLNEFDFANPAKWYHKIQSVLGIKKGIDEMAEEYSYIFKLFERLRKHTKEALDNLEIDTYRENIELVSSLSLRGETKVIQNIINSVEFGVFFRDIGIMLYQKKLKEELKLLILDKNIRKNCNPRNLVINDIRVSEMFSSHYSNAICSNLRLYAKLHLDNKKVFELVFVNEFKLYFDTFKLIYNVSQDMDNPIYERMNRDNWCNLMISIGEKMYNGEGSTQLISDYVKGLIDCYINNNVDWSINVINSLFELYKTIDWREYINRNISRFEGERKAELVEALSI
ncbi:hypothetical protein GKZ28_00155 [Clostridium chromiireducens]|uniref:DUF2254 domain-containing protein n=1 Tax=Clostridium chromiireducens TaxID=225345 RepID=A0A964RHR4_9CLOT|nr:hypothetical protein [Clostridium chromiireducens]MVX62112.1 hypothetical protein [Clostridium chromiireducens]